MMAFKMARVLTVLLAAAPAFADEPGGAPLSTQRVPVPDPVREWNTAYTLDIPADLGRGRGGGNFLTYAPNYGQGTESVRSGAIAPGQVCPNGQPFLQGFGCRPLPRYRDSVQQLPENGALALPGLRGYRQR